MKKVKPSTNKNIKTWFKILLTTLILWSVVLTTHANTVVDSSELIGIGVKQSSYDTLSGPSVTLMEVHVGELSIGTQYIKTHTELKPSYTHVDSLYDSFKYDYKDLVASVINYTELQKIKENELKAKAYLVIPISIILWLLLIWIGINMQNKILINMSCFLLIASIIGTAILLPILLVGLNLATI